MTDKTEKKFAESMDIKPGLEKYLPALLKDLWAMGSIPENIIAILSEARFEGKGKKGLDLGCGKGANSVAVANHFGCKMFGIDLFPPFIDEAVQKAGEHGAAEKCTFAVGDIREFLETPKSYDMVIYSSIGNLFNNYRELLDKLRNQVSPGGLIVISEGFLKKGEFTGREGYESYRSRHNTLCQLNFFSDDILLELIVSDNTLKKQNDDYHRLITARAKKLIIENPEDKDLLEWYLQNQEEECEFLENNFTGATWVIQKAGG